jgi:toxin ParE2
MKVQFLSVAEREMRDTFDWFERQSPGLGADFLAELDLAVSRIRRFPESCPAVAAGMRRALLNRFSYGLWYAVETDAIIVYAVAHLHREPHYWADRMPDTDR